MRRLKLALRHLGATNFAGIARRYFVTNLFDGVLTALGLALGYYFAGGQRASTLLVSALAVSFGLGLSGFVSSYLTEVAERRRELIEMEKALLRKLSGTIFGYTFELAALLSALVNAIAPALGMLVVIAPVLAADAIGLQAAVALSALVGLAALSVLGAYLAKISGTSVIKYSAAMVGAGFAVAGVTVLLGSLGG
ncbi:MAG: hypothetical protein QXT37_04950 [Thermofilaceae archaeon]